MHKKKLLGGLSIAMSAKRCRGDECLYICVPAKPSSCTFREAILLQFEQRPPVGEGGLLIGSMDS